MICVGTSHTVAVKEAALAAGVPLWVVHVKSVMERADDGTPLFDEKLRRNVRKGIIFSMIGGNSHNALGLVKHSQPFDFIHPEHPELDVGSEVLPFEVVRAALARKASAWLEVLEALAAIAPKRIAHFESPPQIEDQEYMAEEYRETLAQRGIGEFEVASPSLRHKLWRLHSAIVSERCAKLGLRFIPAPSESMNERGFLKKEYWGNPTHANAAYGALVLEQMKALAA